MHAGVGINRGEHWVFVLFLLGGDQPQLARRCHAHAIEYIREQQFDKAEEVLQTGLRSISPDHDHLLHNTMGRLHLMRREDEQPYYSYSKALQSFQMADKAYPICQNAMVSNRSLNF